MPADLDALERVAHQIKHAIGEHFNDATSDDDGPTVVEGSFEGSTAPFVVSWEEGPFQWAYELDTITALSNKYGVNLEAVNHFAIAVYPE